LQIRRPRPRQPVAIHFAYSTPDPIRVELACTGPIAMLHSPHMAAKKTTLESLAKLISESSASADKKFAALAEDISDIKATMVTKDDLSELETRLDTKIDSVESNLSGQINRIDTKLTKFEESEIDKRLQLEVRVTTIEKHLGLDTKIAA
jgi:CHAD domain-containing protein